MDFNEVLNYKGNEIENFKKQNEELDIPLNSEITLENGSFSVKKNINHMACRDQAKLLIKNKDINYYFEVSVKVKKGLII